MASTETEDPELDFTNFMEKQKAELAATEAAPEPDSTSSKNDDKPAQENNSAMVRGILFFAVLLVLLGALIFLYMSQPKGSKLIAPEGHRIIQSSKEPPKLEKIK